MTGPIVLPSGRVLSARTAESARRVLASRAERKEGEGLTRLLARLPTGMAVEFRVLWKQAAAQGKADPQAWSDGSSYINARSLLDATIACKQAEVAVESILDLSSAPAVNAVVSRYKTAAGSGQNASRILRGVRPLIRRLGGNISKHMKEAIRDLSRTPRRGENEELPDIAGCLNAAIAEFADAVIMIRNGRSRRGMTRLRDAVIMAVEMATTFRRGEFHAITVDVVFFSNSKSEVRIVIPEAASKVREVQLGVIRDERVIGMLRELVKDKRMGGLFRTNRGTRLHSVSTYKALRRTTKRTVNVALSFNKARRVGVSGETSISAMRGRTRHSSRSETAEQTYSWHRDDIGIDECREKLARYGLPPREV